MRMRESGVYVYVCVLVGRWGVGALRKDGGIQCSRKEDSEEERAAKKVCV